MNIKLHEDVYKVQDPRIKRVLTGGMSLETFAATIGPNDPFVLIHDTIYVMTEQEYTPSDTESALTVSIPSEGGQSMKM